ncbi:MAG: hypothetical protein KDA42_00475 [Planctomycetales bacterium]|nr:hypothetical protein [Planctomycetales bacterium]
MASSKRKRIDTPAAYQGRQGTPRIAFYSHDAMGLGHIRRNVLLGQILQERLNATVLLVSGALDACKFAQPVGIDYMTLPAFEKKSHNRYGARQWAMPPEDLVRMRAQAICGALDGYAPDVLVVDKLPRGLRDELVPALQALRSRGGTHLVLGLRDILDDPETVDQEWRAGDYTEFIRDTYDAVWIYGDPQVYNAVEQYNFPRAIAEKSHFIGYLDQRERLRLAPDANLHRVNNLLDPDHELIVGLVGGGQDGFRLAKAFVQAELPPDSRGVLVAGPCMPAERIAQLYEQVEGRANMSVVAFLPEADVLVACASRLVAMGGYNTICSALSFRKPSLIVPRVAPRSEQWIRASCLDRLGVLQTLHPNELTPAALTNWLAEPPAANIESHTCDLSGLERAANYIEALFRPPTGETMSASISESPSHV